MCVVTVQALFLVKTLESEPSYINRKMPTNISSRQENVSWF